MPLRIAACHALSDALHGSGGIAKAVQEETMKSLKHVLGERGVPVELRVACLGVCPSLVRYAEGLWASDLVESAAAICTKHLEDPVGSVRLAAADALGAMLVAVIGQHFIVEPPPGAKGKKQSAPSTPTFNNKKLFQRRSDPRNAIEAAMLLLSAPFVQKAATKELRFGIAHAFVAFTRGLDRSQLEHSAIDMLGFLTERATSRRPQPGAAQQVQEAGPMPCARASA